ncbi:glutathione S-transferase theta-1-like [Ruditapes philippinarum]|uniref:glutathione S-transferase theta-1-like n=1 Tax=Ruditapes philippinarum TaxID=129788 RepID=UPI00295B0392|nr:glutathione S-transferase theta-1-like [Ruditapes philippinarum]
MATIKLFADLKSQPCRAVYLFMKMNNIPSQMVRIDIGSGEHLQEEFTKISPIQRVPVIEDNGFVLGESGAIFRYLACKFKVADHWYPSKDLQQQGRIDEYLNWHHTNTRTTAAMKFRHQFINTLKGKPIKEDEVKRFKTELKKSINIIDKYFLKDEPYIGGKEISVADLQAFCELMQLDIIGEENDYRFNPKVRAWADRVKGKIEPYFDRCQEEGISPMQTYYNQLKSSKL